MVSSKLFQWLAVAACSALSLTTTQALDTLLDGINYDLRQGPDWDANKCKTETTIAAELKLLKTVTKNVRTYSLSDCDVTPVLTNAKSLGLTVWLGVWVSGDDNVFQNECKVAQKLIDAKLIDDNVIGFNVGSEAVYRKDITSEKAIEYLKSFQGLLSNNSMTKPTAITDIIDTMIAYPDMVAAGDVVTINQFPFWEKIKPSEAADQFLTRIKPLLTLAGSKQVIITETGWPTNGTNENASIASLEASARFLNDFVLLAKEQKWKYYYFQGLDSPWKAATPGEEDTVEAYFGLFAKDGTMKTVFKDLKIAKKTNDKEADAGQSTSGGGAGGDGAGGDSAGTVHGASGSGSSTSSIKKDNSTTPGNTGSSGSSTIGRNIVASLAAVVALALYQ